MTIWKGYSGRNSYVWWKTLSIDRVISHAIRSVENICSEGFQFWDVIDFLCHNLECHIFRAYIKSVVSRNDITLIMPYLGEVKTYHNACLYLQVIQWDTDSGSSKTYAWTDAIKSEYDKTSFPGSWPW